MGQRCDSPSALIGRSWARRCGGGAACLLWIAADHMLAVYHHEQDMEFLAAAAVHCIDVADDVALSLGEWLVDQIKQQE